MTFGTSIVHRFMLINPFFFLLILAKPLLFSRKRLFSPSLAVLTDVGEVKMGGLQPITAYLTRATTIPPNGSRASGGSNDSNNVVRRKGSCTCTVMPLVSSVIARFLPPPPNSTFIDSSFPRNYRID